MFPLVPEVRKAVLIALLASPALAQPQVEVPLAPRSAERLAVLIELEGEPAALTFGRARSQRSLRSLTPQERAVAAAATRSQIQANEAAQAALSDVLNRRFRAEPIYKVTRALNAIAVRVDAVDVEAIRLLPGVRSVRLITPEFPTNSTSMPFLGLPQVWGNTLALPQAYTGTGVRIGIIDTGIDYQHSNFGGTGVLADYQANNRTVAPDAYYPNAKVVGGKDFVGDAYNGSNAAVPDADPMDCNGHGSHVAGTAAGLGVNADGTTFAGPYNPSTPFGPMRIGPGAAPQAQLYALRVFGCTGGTNITVQAIDWSIDPNADGDFSDHLDVINMSLGSTNGSPSDTSAAASENASFAGVMVVASAGNAGDTYFINGSPSVSGRSISVAASADDFPGALLTVNSPAGIAGNYAAVGNSFNPPTPGPTGQTAALVLALDAADGAGPLTTDGCTAPLTNAAAIAGNIAIIDRGTCGFLVKANNAQNAGAIGVIIANNVPGDPNLAVFGGTGPPTITVPTVMISNTDRNTLVAQLPGVNVTLSAASGGDSLASFTSRGPVGGGGGSVTRLKPDLAAPGLNITSVQTGVTGVATYNAGNLPRVLSGTSMSAPHVAGIMALLREQHPNWTIEELKSVAMNTALSDVTIGSAGSGGKLGPGRVGAGRIRPVDAALSDVLAYNAEDAGLVSLSFDGEVVGSVTRVKKLRVVNKGATPATYDLAINTRVDAPGVSFSLPGGPTVTVPAGGEVLIDVQMAADASLMDHAREITVAPLQAAPAPINALGNVARHWLTEEAGFVTLSQSSVEKKRVPFYVNARPAATMTGVGPIVTGGAGTGSTTIALSGGDVCTGTLAAGPSCTGTFPADEVSLVTPFELHVVSPRNTSLPAMADLKHGGVSFSSASGVYMFGVSTWAPWSTPTDVAFNIYVDFNEDGIWDKIVFNSNPGTMASRLFGTASANGQDSFMNGVLTITGSGVSVGGAGGFTNMASAAAVDSRLFNNNTLFLAATPAQLGLPGGDTTFRYKIVTCPGFAPLCLQLNGFKYDEAVGPFFFNSAAQGLDFGGAILASDLNGASLPVTWSTANMATNGSLGALLLHHHNVAGTTDQVVLLDVSSASADLQVTRTDSSPTEIPGTTVTYVTTVTNAGPATATNATVVESMFPLTGVSWTCVGAGGGTCTAAGGGAVNQQVTLPSGASVTFTTIGSINHGATGSLSTSVSVTPPLTVTDSNLANNQATDTDVLVPTANLSVTKTDSVDTVVPGDIVTYSIVVTNAGPSSVSGASLVDTMPANLTGVTWTCAATAGSACGSASGAGSINETMTLLPSGAATFTVTATVGAASGQLINTARVATPSGVVDPDPADNSATDTDQPGGNTGAATARAITMNSTTRDFVSNLRTEVWYRASLFANRSYQISAWPVDHEQGVDAADLSVSLFSDAAGTVPATGVSGGTGVLEAAANAGGDSKPYTAIVQPTTSGVYKVRVQRLSGGAVSQSVNVLLRETTLFSPWTSRAAGFEGFIELHNNTNAPVSVTLRAFDSAGAPQGAGLTISLQPNATDFRTAMQIGVPVNVFAGIVLTHDGAVGAVSANITTLNGANGLSFDSAFGPREPSVQSPPVR